MTMPEVDLPAEIVQALAQVSTATLSMQLLKRGLRHTAMIGPRPLDSALPRFAGPAFTLRFLPLREDLATPESYAKPGSLREAIDAVPRGAAVVIDARGEQGAATLGDILVARLKALGAVAAVSDGPIRDLAEIRLLELPIFCRGSVALPSIARLTFADWQRPIGCGGVVVIPGDIVVGDGDGCVVVPRALAKDVAADGIEQERFEGYVQHKVKQGTPVAGLYPPNEATLADYQAWSAQQGAGS